MKRLDHPIFLESIAFIKTKLGHTGLNQVEQKVLERLIHTTGDFSIQNLLNFSPNACQMGLSALNKGASILTDTYMAAEAIKPMASRTLSTNVRSVLEWSPSLPQSDLTRTSVGMKKAWEEISTNCIKIPSPIVIIGSAPTALETLLDLVEEGAITPSLIVGMPVGFIGVLQSKERLSAFDCPQIRLDGNRGGAALAGAAINALLRESVN